MGGWGGPFMRCSTRSSLYWNSHLLVSTVAGWQTAIEFRQLPFVCSVDPRPTALSVYRKWGAATHIEHSRIHIRTPKRSESPGVANCESDLRAPTKPEPKTHLASHLGFGPCPPPPPPRRTASSDLLLCADPMTAINSR